MTKPIMKTWVSELASAAWLAGCDQRDIGVLLNSAPASRSYRGWMSDFVRAYEAYLMRQVHGIKAGGEVWDTKRRKTA